MAMLAERKQKQRWCLNPRGKHWSEDANKFGQKMLQKMGWSSGKGLGAKEDGMTEHVKIGYKNDAKGIGFKDNGEQWTKHQVDFTSLLANLAAGEEAKQISVPQSEKSLVKKSQVSRARVHYKKFTRGKDLTQRSEKDLANIFGRKTLEQIQIPQEEDVAEESKDTNFGVATVTAGNMADYFKTKLSSFGMCGKASPTIKVEQDEEESESEIGRVGFGFISKSKEEQEDNLSNTNFSKIQFVSAETVEETTTKRKRKLDDVQEEGSIEKESKKSKKKKKQHVYDNLANDVKIDEEMCFDNPCLNDKEDILENCAEENIDESSAKKKKNVTFSSPIAEVLNKSDESVDNEVKVIKKEKNKKSKVVAHGIDNPACEEIKVELEETSVLVVNNFEVQTKKSKKKKSKQEMGIDNLACEETSVNEKNEEIRKYKLKKQAMENGIENLACEENLLDVNEVAETEENTKKSKKNKKPKREFEESNNSVVSIEEETKKNKNKRKSEKIEDMTVESPEQLESPKLKNKKRKTTQGTIEENGISNLACEINTIEEGIASINDEIDSYQNVLENEMNFEKIQKLESNSQAQNIAFDTVCTNSDLPFKTSFKVKKALKNDIKAGFLRLGFQGTNLMKVVGYGESIQLKARRT